MTAKKHLFIGICLNLSKYVATVSIKSEMIIRPEIYNVINNLLHSFICIYQVRDWTRWGMVVNTNDWKKKCAEKKICLLNRHWIIILGSCFVTNSFAIQWNANGNVCIFPCVCLHAPCMCLYSKRERVFIEWALIE